MNKEFIPYNQALELKELGFDEPCFGYYENGVLIMLFNNKQENELLLNCCAATFSQAFRWFREKHLLFSEIKVDRTTEPKFWFSTMKYESSQFLEGWYDDEPSDFLYRTYEEAELACLNKLIEIVKRGEQ